MPKSFTDTVNSLSNMVGTMASAREADSRTAANKIANKASFMDLQHKIRMLPELKMREQMAGIESEVALKRANERMGLLKGDPSIIERQEKMKLDAETDELMRNKYTGTLSAVSQWQGPITTSNLGQFKQHLESSGTSFEEAGYSEDMTPAQVGILQKAQTDMFAATQAQIQKKDLMDIEQQYKLTSNEENIKNQFEANSKLSYQGFLQDALLQRQMYGFKMKLEAMEANGERPDLQDLYLYKDVDKASSVVASSMATRFANAPMFEKYGQGNEEADVKGNMFSKSVMEEVNREVTASYRAGVNEDQVTVLNRVMNKLPERTTTDGKFLPEGSEELIKSREKWIKDASAQIQSTPQFQNLMANVVTNPAWARMSTEEQQAAINEEVHEIGMQWWGNPVARGWTSAEFSGTVNGPGRGMLTRTGQGGYPIGPRSAHGM